jgi:hypothetical protein
MPRQNLRPKKGFGWSVAVVTTRTMIRNELFSAVKESLNALEVAFRALPEESLFDFTIHTDEGSWLVRIVCEDEPPVVHVFCRLGVKPDRQTAARLSRVMHALNNRIRLGAFYVDEGGFPTFRLALPVNAEVDVNNQIGFILGSAMATMEHHLRVLSFAATDCAGVRQQLSELLSGAENGSAELSIPKSRLELN